MYNIWASQVEEILWTLTLRFTVFVIFWNFGLKNVFRKVKISQRRKKVATNFDIFCGILKVLPFSITPLLFVLQSFMSKNSLEGVLALLVTSLKSHVPHLIHLMTLFEAIPIDCYLDQVFISYLISEGACQRDCMFSLLRAESRN